MTDTSVGRNDHRRLNQANWDDRVPIHVGSPVDDAVRFDQPRLGDLRGMHPKCHIGTDTCPSLGSARP